MTLRQLLIVYFFYLALFLANFANAQFDSASASTENNVSNQVSISDAGDVSSSDSSIRLLTGWIDVLSSALLPVYKTINAELALIEGDTVGEKWQWIRQRIDSGQISRIVWLLILGLLVSGFLFITTVIWWFISSRESKITRISKTDETSESVLAATELAASQKSTEPTKSQRTLTRTSVSKLQAGEIEEAEKLLKAELQKEAGDEKKLIYLFACRAMRNDPKSYSALISELYPDGMNSELEISRHIAQIGRLIGVKEFSAIEFPSPANVFDEIQNQKGSTLGSISEFGNVQTLLDLIRVYIEMESFNDAKHLIVEVLVRGDEIFRKNAIEYLVALKN